MKQKKKQSSTAQSLYVQQQSKLNKNKSAKEKVTGFLSLFPRL